MKTIVQAILLFSFIIFEVHGASFSLRYKRQSSTELPQIGEQRDPLRHWQQVPQLDNQKQSIKQAEQEIDQEFDKIFDKVYRDIFGDQERRKRQDREGRIFGGQQIDNNQNSSTNSDSDEKLYYGAFGGLSRNISNLFYSPPSEGDFRSADGSPAIFIPGVLRKVPTLQTTEKNSAASVSTTTPSTSNVRTTPSQSYLRCLSSCPTTMEYNPVCGSDSQDYHNEHRLRCANQCGNNVRMVRMGTCQPLRK